MPFSSEDTWWGKRHLLQTVAVFGNEMFTKSINGVTLRILENGCMRDNYFNKRTQTITGCCFSPAKTNLLLILSKDFQNGIRFILDFRFNQFSDKR